MKSVCGVMLPSEVSAFMLLRRVRVEDGIKRSLILSKFDYNTKIQNRWKLRYWR